MTRLSERVTRAAILLFALSVSGASNAIPNNTIEVMNLYATETALQVQAVLGMSGEKITGGNFSRTDWSGSTTTEGFDWKISGIYLGDPFTATSVGRYHPVGDLDPNGDAITWSTSISWRSYDLSDEGQNIFEEVPEERGFFKRLKSAWKSVRTYVDKVVKIVKTAQVLSDQIGLVTAIPHPITGVIAAVYSTGKIYDTWGGLAAAVEGEALELLDLPVLGSTGFGSQVYGEEDLRAMIFTGMDGSLSERFPHLYDTVGELSAEFGTVGLARAGVNDFSGGGLIAKVPEPGSLALLGLGLAGLGVFRRRLKR